MEEHSDKLCAGAPGFEALMEARKCVAAAEMKRDALRGKLETKQRRYAELLAQRSERGTDSEQFEKSMARQAEQFIAAEEAAAAAMSQLEAGVARLEAETNTAAPEAQVQDGMRTPNPNPNPPIQSHMPTTASTALRTSD